MDKYQEYLINRIDHSYFDLATSGETNGEDSAFQGNRDKIVLKQNEDITMKDYTLYIANRAFESVVAIAGTTQTPFKQEHDPVYSSPNSGDQNRFYLPIDFEHKIDSIKIVFKNNLANDLILPVVYEEADKKAYYAKQEKKHKDDLLATAAIKCSTGADLVNIYFQPCSNEYSKTEIILYHDGQMLAKYKVDEDCFFKSIGGLAYGQYSFVLKQYDENSKLILETEQHNFVISPPDYDGSPQTVVH